MRIKSLSLPFFGAISGLMMIAGCAQNAVAPPGRSVPVTAPPPAAPPPSAPKAAFSWTDAPLSSGAWQFTDKADGAVAAFGRAGAPADFTMRCDLSRGLVLLQRAVPAPLTADALITVATSAIQRSVAARPTSPSSPYLTAEIPAKDPLLDAMAFSRGRFAIILDGQTPLILPSWVEVTRVVEACRP